MEAKIPEDSELEEMDSDPEYQISPLTFGAESTGPAVGYNHGFTYTPGAHRSRKNSINADDTRKENNDLKNKILLVSAKLKSILHYTRQCHKNIKQQIHSEKQMYIYIYIYIVFDK